MNKQKGITLVSLVITIIVMLILAGVSLNMVMGDNSVLLQAQKSAFIQKMAGYKEELALSYLGSAAKQLKSIKKEEITVMGEYVKEYIPSNEFDRELFDKIVDNISIKNNAEVTFELIGGIALTEIIIEKGRCKTA